MTLEIPIQPLVIDEKNTMEVLKAKSANYKSNHEQKLELDHLEHANKVQMLSAQITVLTIFVIIDNEYQG